MSFLTGKKKNKGANRPPAPDSLNQTTSSNAGNQNNTPLKRGRDFDDGDGHQTNKKVDTKSTPEKRRAAAVAMGLKESDLADCTDEELSNMVEEIQIDGKATTYAATAAKKVTSDPNLVVYFHKGYERREPCKKADFDNFLKHILEVIGYNSKACDLVLMDWSGYGMGRGVIACLDVPTINFLKEEAKKFTVTLKNGDKIGFKIWTKKEFGSRDIFSGFLHGKTYGDQKGLDVLRWIFQINGLRDAKPILIMYQKHPKGKGVFLKFEADFELKEALLNKSLVLRAGICLLKLNHKHVEGEADQAEKVVVNEEPGPTPSEASAAAKSADINKMEQ